MGTQYHNIKNAISQSKTNMNMEFTNMSNNDNILQLIQDTKHDILEIKKEFREEIDNMWTHLKDMKNNQNHPTYINKNLFALSNNLNENLKNLKTKYEQLSDQYEIISKRL